MALTERPGLVVVDMDLPEVHGVEVARQIWADIPDMKIIFWAQFADETYMRQTFRLIPPETVYGYLLKSASADQFVAIDGLRGNEAKGLAHVRFIGELRPDDDL